MTIPTKSSGVLQYRYIVLNENIIAASKVHLDVLIFILLLYIIQVFYSILFLHDKVHILQLSIHGSKWISISQDSYCLSRIDFKA